MIGKVLLLAGVSGWGIAEMQSYWLTHSRKQISEDGSANNEFLINEEFITMLDSYVLTSLSATSSEAESLRTLPPVNVQGPQRTARETRGLHFLMCWMCGCCCFQRLQATWSKNKGRLSLGSSTDAQPSAVSADDLWAERCALRGSSGGWPDRAAPSPIAVAAALFRWIINTKGVRNFSLC